jgi:hypothetical protein
LSLILPELLLEMRGYAKPVPESQETPVQAEQKVRLAAEGNSVESIAEGHALAKPRHSAADRDAGVGERFLH